MKKASPFAFFGGKRQRATSSLGGLLDVRPTSSQMPPGAPNKMQVNDLNVVVVTFQKTKQAEKNIGAGDPYYCSQCKVCFNKSSRLLSRADYELLYVQGKNLPNLAQEKPSLLLGGQVQKPKPQNIELIFSNSKKEQVEKPKPSKTEKIPAKLLELSAMDSAWVCEFCNFHNKIRIEKQEVPTSDDLVYIIQSASNKQINKQTVEPTIVFCLDTSGSMNSTQEVLGKVELKHGVSQAEIDMLRQFMEPGDQAQLNFIPGQSRSVTYVSRKQCVMAAIEQQLMNIKTLQPNKKVGLVTFNNEVVVYGDCKKAPVHIVGDKLGKYNQIVESVEPIKVQQPVKVSYQQIIHNFNKLEAAGSTALGPAVLSAIELASKGAPGSTVIVCTDGIANIGLGNLDAKAEESKQFYDQLALRAKSKNIGVNLVTIKGEDCKIASLVEICRATNGSIIIVDPVNISQKFANILKDQIVALNSTVRVRLHSALRFRNQLPQNLKENGSLLQKQVGNATAFTKVSFEYELRSDQELKQLGINAEDIKKVFFQSQITYTSLAGHKILRVITADAQIASQRGIAQQHVELPVVHARIAQQTAAYHKHGDIEKMKEYNQEWVDYLNEKVAVKEQLAIENEKLCKRNAKAKQAFVNKLNSDKAVEYQYKFEQGRNFEDLD